MFLFLLLLLSFYNIYIYIYIHTFIHSYIYIYIYTPLYYIVDQWRTQKFLSGFSTPWVQIRFLQYRWWCKMFESQFMLNGQCGPPKWKIIYTSPKMGVPQKWWFVMENPISMDDLGVPPFQETTIYFPLALWTQIPWRDCKITTNSRKKRHLVSWSSWFALVGTNMEHTKRYCIWKMFILLIFHVVMVEKQLYGFTAAPVAPCLCQHGLLENHPFNSTMFRLQISMLRGFPSHVWLPEASPAMCGRALLENSLPHDIDLGLFESNWT